MTNADLLIGLISVLLGTAFYFLTTGLPPGYMKGIPGPAFFPRLITTGLIIIGILLIIKGIKDKKRYFTNSDKYKYLFYIIIATAVYVSLWIFELGTFIVNSFIYFSIIIYLLGEKRIKYTLAISAGFSIFTYYFFTKVLHILL